MQYLQNSFVAGALNPDVANSFIAISDPATYLRAVDLLNPEISVDTQISALHSELRFADALLSCAEQSGTYRYFDDGQCGWLITNGHHFSQNATSDNFGFDESGWQVAMGGQRAIGQNWRIGAAFSYEQKWLNAPSLGSSSDINQYNLGMSVKVLLAEHRVRRYRDRWLGQRRQHARAAACDWRGPRSAGLPQLRQPAACVASVRHARLVSETTCRRGVRTPGDRWLHRIRRRDARAAGRGPKPDLCLSAVGDRCRHRIPSPAAC